MTLLEKVYINLDQRSTWPGINVDGHRHIFLPRLLDSLAILGNTSTRSIEIIVSDRHLSSKFGRLVVWNPAFQAQWAEIRWTLEEKRDWVEKVKMAIQDRQSLVRNEGSRRVSMR